MNIIIPFKTPTINHLYFTHNNRQILTKEARALKEKITGIVKQVPDYLKENYDEKKLYINIYVYEDWYCLNGDVKRKDVANREKFLVDSIFEALGLDDKYVFSQTMQKIQSEAEEKSIIEIGIIE